MKSVWPKPRMKTAAALLLPLMGAVESNSTLGVNSAICEMSTKRPSFEP